MAAEADTRWRAPNSAPPAWSQPMTTSPAQPVRTNAHHQAQPGQTYAQYLTPGQGNNYTRTQPGIIALRPLGTLEILDGAFRAVRFNPPVMFGVPAAVMALAAIVAAIVNFFLLQSLRLPSATEYSPTLFGVPLDALGSFLLPTIIMGLIAVAGATILVGLLTVAVSRAVIGVHASGTQVWTQVRRRLWPLLGATALVALATLAAPVLLVVLASLCTLATSPAPFVLTLVLGIPAMICASSFLAIRTLLVVPVVMLEGLGPVAGLTRGWALTRGSFWRLAGTYAATVFLVGFAIALTVVPLLMASSMLADLASSEQAAVLGSISSALSLLLAATLVLPYLAAIVTLLYIDVRIRTEALDLTLSRDQEA